MALLHKAVYIYSIIKSDKSKPLRDNLPDKSARGDCLNKSVVYPAGKVPVAAETKACARISAKTVTISAAACKFDKKIPITTSPRIARLAEGANTIATEHYRADARIYPKQNIIEHTRYKKYYRACASQL